MRRHVYICIPPYYRIVYTKTRRGRRRSRRKVATIQRRWARAANELPGPLRRGVCPARCDVTSARLRVTVTTYASGRVHVKHGGCTPGPGLPRIATKGNSAPEAKTKSAALRSFEGSCASLRGPRPARRPLPSACRRPFN